MRQFLFGTFLRTAFAAVLYMAVATAARADVDPAGLTKARELMEASGVEESFRQLFPIIVRQLGDLLQKANPDRGDEVNEIMETKMTPKVLDRSGELIELVAHVYAEHFTVDELDQLVEFYESPIGRKLVGEQTEVMKESMAIGRRWGTAVGEEVMQELAPEFEKRGLKMPNI
jgi:uncharacterized protein